MKISKDFQGLALPTGSKEEYILMVTKEELEILREAIDHAPAYIDEYSTNIGASPERLQKLDLMLVALQAVQ